MRILQVVTLISPDGAYGGPTRVALNQSRELIRRGHDVTIAAATRGYPTPPSEIDDVPVHLFEARTRVPRTGFAGMGARGLLRWYRRASADFDVVHIHLGRDLVVLPVAVAARQAHRSYVVQTHGMVIPSRHPLAPLLDAAFTRRVLRDARAVFDLNDTERDALVAVARSPVNSVRLPNGVPDYAAAQSLSGVPQTSSPEILYAARLHARKQPMVFVEMALRMLAAGVDARFTLIGPDEGEADAVSAAIDSVDAITWEGPLNPAAMPARLAAASVYVLPSVREPYPMSVLEAMAVGLPVVITDDCGLAPLVSRTGSGVIARPTPEDMAAAVTGILAEPDSAARMGACGRRAVRAEADMADVGDILVDTYTSMTGAPHGG